MEKRTDNILDQRRISSLGDDILFQRELSYSTFIQKKIFFDTAGVIDMLLGLDRLFQGGKIQWKLYRRPSVLVCALAYRNWLGTINTLPPHTQELINKIQNKKSLFKENSPEDSKILRDQFWTELNLSITDLKAVKEKGKKLTDWIENLKLDSLDSFKGVYLDTDTGFWKNRYKKLVKDNQILNFFSDQSYNIKEITKNELFNAILQKLNRERRDSSHNNYTDAVALTILDQNLQEFENAQLISPITQQFLPLFFSDQEHILNTVKYFSEHPVKKGRRPFIYRGKTGDFLIVRNANFFILEGIVNAIKEDNESFTINEFISNSYPDLPIRIQEELKNNVQDSYDHVSQEKVLLEFFDKWYDKEGFDELEKIMVYNISEENKKTIDTEILLYIDNERARLKDYFDAFKSKFFLIRKIWNEFEGLEKFIHSNFPKRDKKIDVYKEFMPRFSYTEDVCNEVTDICNHIFSSIENNDPDGLSRAKAEVVSDIIHALFDSNESEKIKLDNLAKGLAILWIFELYDLVEEICYVLHKQYSENGNNSDEYPSPVFALMHAAAIFLGSRKDEQKVQRIIECVTKKFGNSNYKVWIGLSFLYFLLWRENVDSYDFPEIHYSSNHKYQFVENNKYLYHAREYSKEAIEYLIKLKKNNTFKEKLKDRQSKYFYAVNNYIFLNTIIGEPREFLDVMEYANILEDVSEYPVYWQEARFPDTLARYFFRLAFLSENQEEFLININEAERFNNQAIEASKRERSSYRKLNRKIRKWKSRGYGRAKQFADNYKPFVISPEPLAVFQLSIQS